MLTNRACPPGFPAGLRRLLAVVLAGLLLLAGACAPEKPSPESLPPLREVAPKNWPLFYDDLDPASFQEACQGSLTYLRRVPPDKKYRFGPDEYTAAEMASFITWLSTLLTTYPDPAARTQALQERARLYESVGNDGQGTVLITGYYEPVLPATRQPAPLYQCPLYMLPADLVTINLQDFRDDLPDRRLVGRVDNRKVVPYYDREAIDFEGALQEKAQVLGYLADPVEAFFLHIQGSGQLKFPDGGRIRVGFAGTNGHPYRSVGKLLLAEKLMEASSMSMQGIKAFLEAHPEERRRVLSSNPSYVFFRPLPAEGGPLGCYDQPLTAARSVATDRRIFPGLAVGFLTGTRPAGTSGETALSRFIVNQDTGGAIRGPGRLDLFYGSGDQAGELAGRTKNLGRLYFLAPRRG